MWTANSSFLSFLNFDKHNSRNPANELVFCADIVLSFFFSNWETDFIDDELETEGANKIGRLHHLPFLLKEEELSDDELEKLLKERYGRGSNNVVYADENQDSKDYNDRVHSMNSAKDPTIWRVKCMVIYVSIKFMTVIKVHFFNRKHDLNHYFLYDKKRLLTVP